ncbi:enolase C-terminal domain-like protein [Gemmata sp.]|uniref:enolase C-terminal domain-like protein n=1 Tax=Gemmata sp. TaxID=1914242 RepID=UPI003F72146B
MRSTDVTIRDLSVGYDHYRYRTPIKFGGVALDRVTLLNVRMVVEDAQGKRGDGFGSMPLGNVWAWPSRSLDYTTTLTAMQSFAAGTAALYLACKQSGHPIDITHTLEPVVLAHVPGGAPVEPMPALAKLVVASAFDAALHDAYGKLHSRNCFSSYGPEFLEHDLGHYLGAEFAGDRLDRYVTAEPKATMPLYHLVGALDPITRPEVAAAIGDGLPESLDEWIARDGLTHLKIKLNGDDLDWDVHRVVHIDKVASEALRLRAGSGLWYSLDFNERCQNVAYLLEFLRRVKDRTPTGYDRIQYVEQPTARDLKANPANRMHEAAKLKPVVIDESLLDLESLLLAREMGYTGVAFKACKGQTQTLLLAAAAQKFGLFRCVQDLTCVGASLIHSASIAAHVPGVAAIESNGRQYCPAANASWDARFPGVFTIRNGTMNTAVLNGPGLGAV